MAEGTDNGVVEKSHSAHVAVAAEQGFKVSTAEFMRSLSMMSIY
jgi:hypothetical protein